MGEPLAGFDVDAAIRDPADHFGSPMDVVTDPRLDRNQKQRILEAWQQDALLLSTAEAENMPGDAPPRLQEVKLALLELQELDQQRSTQC